LDAIDKKVFWQCTLAS